VTSKITAILLIFTQGSEHSLTEIARLAGLPVSTAHRLATELVARRLLDRAQDGSYRAGPPLRLIGTVDRSRPRIAERAPWVLEDLCDATGSRVRLGVLRDSTVVSYIEKHPGPVPATSFTPAATVPAHPTALGRALVAFAPARTVEMTILLGLRPYTGHTVTPPGPVPAGPDGHPADRGRDHPRGVRGRDLRGGHAAVRTRRRGRRRDRGHGHGHGPAP
jgi:DNA-binding IclR family transcriptional regulator